MLASCATISSSQQKYETNKAIVEGSPRVKQRSIERCAARVTLSSTVKRERLAELANTSLEKVPQVYCSRIWNALADGRVSANDYLALDNHNITPNMIKIIQGR